METEEFYRYEDLLENEYELVEDADPSTFREGIEKVGQYNSYIKMDGKVYRILKVPKPLGFILIADFDLPKYKLVSRNLFVLNPTSDKDIFKEIHPISEQRIYMMHKSKKKIYYKELSSKKGFIWSETNEFEL